MIKASQSVVAALFAVLVALMGSAPARAASLPAGPQIALDQASKPETQSVWYRRGYYRPYGFYRRAYYRPYGYYRRPVYVGGPYYARRCIVRPRIVWTPYGYRRRLVRICRW